MIGVCAEPGFLARQFFEMSFGGLRPTFLQALPKRLMALTYLFNLRAAERFRFSILRDTGGEFGFRKDVLSFPSTKDGQYAPQEEGNSLF